MSDPVYVLHEEHCYEIKEDAALELEIISQQNKEIELKDGADIDSGENSKPKKNAFEFLSPIKNFGSSIKEAIISKERQEAFQHIEYLFEVFFKDVPFNKIDVMLGLMMLSDYYKNTPTRTGALITNPEYVRTLGHYMRYASCCYGWKFIYGLLLSRPKGFLAGITSGDSANIMALCEHTGISPEDIVLTQWTSTLYNPGHFLALDHKKKTLVLAIRGTFTITDCITDLVATDTHFMEGRAHAGILRAARQKMETVTPTILECLEKYPTYQLVVVGHSLGAGAAALFTLLFHKEYPDVDIHCYAYAPPCVLSAEMAMSHSTKSLIDSIVYNDDIIPRLSFASLSHLKQILVQILSQTNGTVQRTFHWMATANVFGQTVSNKIATSFKLPPRPEIHKVDQNLDVQMFPPGNIYHIFQNTPNDETTSSTTTTITAEISTSPSSTITESTVVTTQITTESSNGHKKGNKDSIEYLLEYSNPALFTEIIVSSTLFGDHMPNKYELGLEKCLATYIRKENE